MTAGRIRRLRLATAAPRAAAGFTSTWRPIGGDWVVHARRSVRPDPAVPRIVLVHGLAVSHRYLMPTAVELARTHGVDVVDLPGFGLSGDPGRALGTDEHADALAQWLRVTGQERAVLLGNSYGCQVAVATAVRHPELVAALVLSGPTVDPEARTVPQLVGRWLRDALREDPLQAPILLRDARDAGLGRIAATLQHATRDRIEERLPHVAVPTLVVRGEREPLVPQPWAEQAAALLPRGELAVLPDSPHNSVYVRPDALADLVLPFVARAVDGPVRTARAAAGGTRGHGSGRAPSPW